VTEQVVIHELALCRSSSIGRGTEIGAFASIAANVVVGEGCFVAEAATIGPGVVIEDGVRVGAGARIVANVALAAMVQVHENAVLGGGEPTNVGPAAVIGPNVTVLPGVDVGRGAVLEAGARVASPVPANAVVRGNPAVIVDYVGSGQPMGVGGARDGLIAPAIRGMVDTRVPGVRLFPLTHATDLRGSLVAADFGELPFVPLRAFAVIDVPSELIRGSHAHRECEQFLVCLAGSINCVVDDGHQRDEVRLDTPEVGLHLPSMIWGTQYKYTRDAVLLVLASAPYVAEDYIRDYDEFLDEVNRSA
jgi:acetyltransferase-like isoleucine patch superfamily enzyme